MIVLHTHNIATGTTVHVKHGEDGDEVFWKIHELAADHMRLFPGHLLSIRDSDDKAYIPGPLRKLRP